MPLFSSSYLIPLSLSLLLRHASSCTVPAPLEVGGLSTDMVISKLAAIAAPYMFLPLADPYIGALVQAETPIQFRLANLHGTNVYNVVAMYDDTALDIYGRQVYRMCPFTNSTDKRAHETVAAAYAFAYSAITGAPDCEADIRNIMDNVLELPMALLDNQQVVDTSTPWGLAKATIDQGYNFGETDGWNEDGTLYNTYNSNPYTDFDYVDAQGNSYSRYKPNPNTGSKNFYGDDDKCRTQKDWNWEPLMESDGRGYFTRQEHVTPHCGFTGRVYGLSKTEYESFSSPYPNYDYCFESNFVLDKTAALATSDLQKMEVELFDSKFTSLLPLQIQWSIKSGFSEFEFWYYDMALVIAMYDATLLVWRDKILFNRIRPTTVMQELRGDNTVTSYAGPFQGVKSMLGKDWNPYKRTMPHAEYPSGSACICAAYAEVLQMLSPLGDELGVPVEQFIAAGSSLLEKDVVPASDITLTYTKWSEIKSACGASRENGGMHFSQAVPAGDFLCTGVGHKIKDKAVLLKNGDIAGTMVDFDDRSISVKTKYY